MAEKCPNPIEGCPYVGRKTCTITRHHLYHPANQYETPVEKEFRNLPENIEMLERCVHDEAHHQVEPPNKPDLTFMLDALRRCHGES